MFAVPAAAKQQPGQQAVVLTSGQAGLKGMVAHWWYLQQYGATLLDDYVRLGVTNVRLTVDWYDIEETEGQRNFEHLDPIMDAFADRGIEVVPVVATVPAWASLNPDECASNTRLCSMNVSKLGAFHSTMGDLVAHYPEARRWEFWNEPEMWAGLRRPSDYEPWYRAFRDAAKAANPQAVVAVGTLTGWKFVSGLSGDLPIDAVTVHPYAGDNWGLDTDMIQRLHDGLVSRGLNVPIWITEYGWGQWMDPVRRASTINQVFRWMQTQPYIEIADYHMLHDSVEADECCWGLVGPPPGFAPHEPAFDAFQSVVVEDWTATPRAHPARFLDSSPIVPMPLEEPVIQTEDQSQYAIQKLDDTPAAAPEDTAVPVGDEPTPDESTTSAR